MKARFVIDWDSTLVEDLYPDQGDWLPGAVSALHELARHGDIVIFSCRVAGFEFPTMRHPADDVPRNPETVALTVERMSAMLTDVGLGHVEIWQRPYKPNATVYIDDKGVRFTGWPDTLDAVYDALKPVTTGMEIMQFRDPGRTVADDAPRHIAEFEIVSDDEPDMESYVRLFTPTMTFMATDVLYSCACDPDDMCTRSCMEPTPTRHPNSERFHALLKEAGDLHDVKQADYGKGDDPFANVRSSEDWNMPAWVGAMVRLNDKVKRLQKLAATGGLMNESAIDSFMDIAVYALIARVLYEQQA